MSHVANKLQSGAMSQSRRDWRTVGHCEMVVRPA